MKKPKIIILVVGFLLVGSITVFCLLRQEPAELSNSPLPRADEMLNNEDGSKIDISRLNEGVLPPTNSWLSGAVLQKDPQPVYPLPLSIKTMDNSIEIGLPKPNISAGLITAPHLPDSKIDLGGEYSYKLSKYDKLSATLTYYKDNNEAFDLTFAEGSPYIFIKSSKDQSLDLLIERNIKFDVHNGASVSKVVNNISSINMPQNGLLTIYPDVGNGDQKAKISELSSNRLQTVKTDYEVKESKVETKLEYATENGEPTVFVSLPHQSIEGDESSHGSLYTGLYGEMLMYSGNKFSFSAQKFNASNSLDITDASSDNIDLIKNSLISDYESLDFTAKDTYFGGKELYKASNLLKIAKQLDDKEIADKLLEKIRAEYGLWLDDKPEKSFYFDNKIKGVVGKESSFGSEDFNDHHFHYSYFLYAASILAEYDKAFIEQYGDYTTLLALDIANYEQTLNTAPVIRSFDPYKSHSWASGSSPFADGNNQESSSEAINAWSSVALWGEASKNKTLKEVGEWMLGSEIESSKQYWFDQDNTYINTEFARPIFSLNWGGKRDFATFFSAEETSIIGIQFIPLPPVMNQYKIGLDKWNKINAPFEASGYTGQFSDYAIMLSSQYDASTSLGKARQIDDKAIDSANTRTYMYAWIVSNSK